jgi:hypothetical protein
MSPADLKKRVNTVLESQSGKPFKKGGLNIADIRYLLMGCLHCRLVGLPEQWQREEYISRLATCYEEHNPVGLVSRWPYNAVAMVRNESDPFYNDGKYDRL